MKRKILSFLLIIALALTWALPALAAETETDSNTEETVPVIHETIEIRNTEEFLAFARNCTLDIWSQDKHIILKADISLAGTDFLPIPTFGGIFDGNGHTIKGFTLKDSVLPAGLFGYLQPTAQVRNLNVEGKVIPSGDAKNVGGIVGSNQGLLENVTFRGRVEGTQNVGGIAGVNHGTIRNCTSAGYLVGEKHTGGIAGYNTGLLDSCSNSMEINTESVDPTINPMEIDVDFTMDIGSISDLNTSAAATDTGGIAGYSAGIVTNCRNEGPIGYPHIGYNLGGILGRNSGYAASCENTGTVHGRKDVGGIVGQIEPDIATILSPDYLEKLSDQFENLGNLISGAGGAASAAGSQMQSYIETIGAYQNRANAALNSIASGFSLEEGFTDLSGFSELAAAIQGMVGVTNAMAQTMGEGVEDMTASVGAISGQVNSIAKTFEMASEDLQKEAVVDASEVDIAEIKSGKVYHCTNSGYVYADINAGGIVGVMGLEAEADPEDDLSGGGTATQRRQYEMKAIVQDCINTGATESKQDYAGGICGRMELGLITGAENYGNATSTNGDYVGGIAGLAGGTIRRSYAKCTLSGRDYIGGIAGNGVSEDLSGGSSLIADCRSMVEIENYRQYVGAVSGGENGTYTGNIFVSDTLGGVNRVSYYALAEPVSYEELLKREDTPAGMRKLTLTFVVDGKVVKTRSFDYGASFDHTAYPQIPDKEGYYARWDTGDLTDLRFDAVVTAEYYPHNTALSSVDVRANGNPIAFVQGSFQEGDILSMVPGATPFPTEQRQTLLEQWMVSIPADGLDSHIIRYLATEDAVIYVLKNGVWIKADTQAMGSYLAFQVNGAEVEFAAVRETFPWMQIILGIVLGICVLGILVVLAVKRRKKRKEAPQAKKPKKALWIVLVILALGCTAAVLWWIPQTKAGDTLAVYDVLKAYIEQPRQAMTLEVHAKVEDVDLSFQADVQKTMLGEKPVTIITENERTLYFSDGVVFLENGTAYRVNNTVPDYSELMKTVADVYSLVEITGENGVYSITAQGNQATELLKLLIPAAESLLPEDNKLTMDVITEESALTQIHFTGAGTLTNSVKTPFSLPAVLKIADASQAAAIPEIISDALAAGNYQAQEIYSDDLVRLRNAWRELNTHDPIGTGLTVGVDCGPVSLNETFRVYQWKYREQSVFGVEKDGHTVYFCDGLLCSEDGKTIDTPTTGDLDIAALMRFTYKSIVNSKFQCQQQEDSWIYTVTVTKAGMETLIRSIAPQALEMGLVCEDGRIQLEIADGMIRSVHIICGGNAQVLAAQIDARFSVDMKILEETDSVSLPDGVKTAITNHKEN